MLDRVETQMRGMLFLLLGLAYSAAAQTLVINEFLASNSAHGADEAGEYDDWVEIYNPGSEAVDLAGLWFSDTEGIAGTQIPFGQPELTTVPAGGFKLVWFDEDLDQGPLHVDDKLSAGGEAIVMLAEDSLTVIDSYVFEEQDTDISEGRSTDGGETWDFFNLPTPGISNTESPLPELKINEFLASNVSGIQDDDEEYEDWLEIYNAGAWAVDLAGYHVSTSMGNTGTMVPSGQPLLTTVPAGGFLLLWMDGETEEGLTHMGNTLSSAGGSIVLWAPDGETVIDSYSYEDQDNDVSEGRSSDGGADWTFFSSPTPGESNGGPLMQTLWINEYLASNDFCCTDENGEYDDWAEVYNPGPDPVDMAGLWFSDDASEPATQIPEGFPELTVVPPGGFAVLWFDEQPEQGPLHIDSKLSGDGETVAMFHPNGVIMEAVDYGPQVTDQSEGRETDGGESWVFFPMPTPGASNQATAIHAAPARPQAFGLGAAYPNPFNPATTVRFRLAEAGMSALRVYDLQGALVQRIELGPLPVGEHRQTLTLPAAAASGLYLLELHSGQMRDTQKILLLK